MITDLTVSSRVALSANSANLTKVGTPAGTNETRDDESNAEDPYEQHDADPAAHGGRVIDPDVTGRLGDSRVYRSPHRARGCLDKAQRSGNRNHRRTGMDAHHILSSAFVASRKRAARFRSEWPPNPLRR